MGDKKTAMEKAASSIQQNKAKSQNMQKGVVGGFTALLENPAMQKEIGKACAKHLTPTRIMRIARTAIQRQPELWNCSPISFVGAIIDCAQLGLEPIPKIGRASCRERV